MFSVQASHSGGSGTYIGFGTVNSAASSAAAVATCQSNGQSRQLGGGSIGTSSVASSVQPRNSRRVGGIKAGHVSRISPCRGSGNRSQALRTHRGRFTVTMRESLVNSAATAGAGVVNSARISSSRVALPHIGRLATVRQAGRKMTDAYHADSALQAEAALLGLGHRNEPARNGRFTCGRRCFGNLASDGFEPDWVASGGQPGEHLLHRHPPQDLGAAEHLIRGDWQLTGTVDGAHPWPQHGHPPSAQRHRAAFTAVAHRGPFVTQSRGALGNSSVSHS
jgi:hypothetical protein